MLFGTSQKLAKLDDNLNIRYREKSINVTLEYKYLGIEIDSTLNLNSHFEKVYKKSATRLKLLAKLRHQMDCKTAKAIYNTMIVPTLTYYNVHLTKRTNVQKQNLESFVNRAKNIIKHRSNDNIHLTSLENIGKQHLCLFVRRCLEKTVPENFENYFKLQQHSIGTRNNNVSIKLPKVRTEYGKRSVKFIGAQVYNSLPLNIRKSENLGEFKRGVKNFFG